MPQPFKNLTGKSFGRWTVEGLAKKYRTGAYWHCRCECGNKKVINGGNLKSGHSKSCGCLLKEFLATKIKHNLSGTKAYQAFHNMHTRCYKADDVRKPYYQDKGIVVCERWHTFENFFADMGHPPGPEYTLDRIDGDKNYEPGNCRWATWSEQNQNK